MYVRRHGGALLTKGPNDSGKSEAVILETKIPDTSKVEQYLPFKGGRVAIAGPHPFPSLPIPTGFPLPEQEQQAHQPR